MSRNYRHQGKKSKRKKKGTYSQFETPATKLLEKRRMMYEVHENFEKKKNEFEKLFHYRQVEFI